jgi:FAD/FMN-containing dehydrogenase
MNQPLSTLAGWGGYPKQEARLLTPLARSACAAQLAQAATVTPRGMGRSYGDSANGATVLQTTALDHFIAFDPDTGSLTVEAGITLRDILQVVLGQGWFLPVTPGTAHVTVGGAIASDVHGKNHHGAGTFTRHVSAMNLLLGTGEIVETSPARLPDLFHATCGGMGLTGVILTATLRLLRIGSAFIEQHNVKAHCLREACELLAAHAGATYSVAWIDCLATGKRLGRSIVMLGEHSLRGGLDQPFPRPLTVPVHAPAALLNGLTMRAFNSLYFAAPRRASVTVPYTSYFYPLDALGAWNRLYGKAGFLQYQFALPITDGFANLQTIVAQIAQSGAGSFLAVLKQFGPANGNLLSFPIEGYTLALDFKLSAAAVALLHRLDGMVVSMGGRVYLAKDAVMRESTFKRCYPAWVRFEEVRHRYGAIGKFASCQSKRLGLA